jgi:hypothetical protein
LTLAIGSSTSRSAFEQGSALPVEVDLTGEMPPAYDQGQLGTCTANATASLLQHTQMKQGEAEGADVPSRLSVK